MDQFDSIKKIVKESKSYEELYNIPWKLYHSSKLLGKYYKNISIGIFNIPCGGFGDIILTKTFNDYLIEWYPTAKVRICTTSPQKYNLIGITDNLIKLERKDGVNYDDGECSPFDKLKVKNIPRFDIMFVVPIINKPFNYNQFKKLIPYSTYFNTFTMSEYNGEFPPYTLPIGVGDENLGILFNNFKYKQQDLIKKPYALVYIQPSPSWGVHARYCFLSYLEMICNKYSKRYRLFQIIIPEWIHEDINYDNQFYLKIKKIVEKYYKNLSIVYPDDEVILFEDNTNKSKLTLRGDILPQKREIFISLMKDSVNDILVTGDQSLTDIISCCKYKIVWYQIAPWKQGLAKKLSEHLPNQYFKSYRTSCGTLDSINLNINWKVFMEKYDFRKKGKKRINSIIIANYHQKKNKLFFNQLLEIIQKSRKNTMVLNKLRTLQTIKKKRKTKRRKKKNSKSKSKSKK
tara:strand:+ start:37 stop:1413 length:1377 start_codon:yes stop_codon:yes gene_type:complete